MEDWDHFIHDWVCLQSIWFSESMSDSVGAVSFIFRLSSCLFGLSFLSSLRPYKVGVLGMVVVDACVATVARFGVSQI